MNVIEDIVQRIVAMRGRNPENPSDRTPGIQVEQRLEPNSEGICNTLTTVQKDNLVLESAQILGHLDPNSNQRYVVYNSEALSPTLQAAAGMGGGQAPYIIEKDLDKSMISNSILEQSRAEQSRAEQSRAEQSRAEWPNSCESSNQGRSNRDDNSRDCRSELSFKQNKERKSDRERKDMSDTDDGECPQCH